MPSGASWRADGLERLLLCLLLPPAAVGMRFGADRRFFTCVILTLCLYVPGAVYAVVVTGR